MGTELGRELSEFDLMNKEAQIKKTKKEQDKVEPVSNKKDEKKKYEKKK